MGLIRIVQGDITQVPVDAVVNTSCQITQNDVSTGENIDCSINLESGDDCNLKSSFETGKAKITKDCEQTNKYIIHTLEPVWQGGCKNEDKQLAMCYRGALRLALENGAKTVAFPSIHEGKHGFPVKRAARIALLEISDFLEDNQGIDKVFLVCYDESIADAYMTAMQEIG